MTESFEHEFEKKLTKIREELSKREVDVRSKLADIERVKVDALKKTEEMKYSAHHDLERVDQDLLKAKDINPQLRTRLGLEISSYKSEVERRYIELRNTILNKTPV